MTQHYQDDSRIRVGHRVTYNNQPGQVVVVVDDDEGSAGYPIEAWADSSAGFLIRFDNGALLFLERADAYLKREVAAVDDPAA